MMPVWYADLHRSMVRRDVFVMITASPEVHLHPPGWSFHVPATSLTSLSELDAPGSKHDAFPALTSLRQQHHDTWENASCCTDILEDGSTSSTPRPPDDSPPTLAPGGTAWTKVFTCIMTSGYPHDRYASREKPSQPSTIVEQVCRDTFGTCISSQPSQRGAELPVPIALLVSQHDELAQLNLQTSTLTYNEPESYQR